MEDKGKEQSSQEEEQKNQWSTEDGLKFLRKLREMPYDTSKIGQVFVTFHGRKLLDIKDSEKEQEKPEEK
jgi:hypothetical protein